MAQNRRGLTLKQLKFVKRYVETGNGKQAIIDTYDVAPDKANMAYGMASENLHKTSIQEAIKRELIRQGLDLPQIISHHKDAIIAGIGSKATNNDSLRGLDMLYKLLGAYQEPTRKSLSLKLDYSKLSKSELFAMQKKRSQFWSSLFEKSPAA